MATISIPSPFRKFTAQEPEFQSKATTVNGLLQDLVATYPDIKKNLFTPEGQLLQFIKVYKGEEDIQEMNGVQTTIGEQDQLTIIPAIAGG